MITRLVILKAQNFYLCSFMLQYKLIGSYHIQILPKVYKCLQICHQLDFTMQSSNNLRHTSIFSLHFSLHFIFSHFIIIKQKKNIIKKTCLKKAVFFDVLFQKNLKFAVVHHCSCQKKLNEYVPKNTAFSKKVIFHKK